MNPFDFAQGRQVKSEKGKKFIPSNPSRGRTYSATGNQEVDIRGTGEQEIAIPKQSLRLPPVGIFVEIGLDAGRLFRECGGDLDYNCGVDFFDFSILGSAWQTEPTDAQWNHLYDISNPADNFIDWRDVAILCDNWLAQVP